MSCQARLWASLLVAVVLCLHGALSQEAKPAGTQKPFVEGLRRLEEKVLKFRRLQESAISRLQNVSRLRNQSSSPDPRLHSLIQEGQALVHALSQSQTTLHSLLESHQSRQGAQEPQKATVSTLALEVRALLDTLWGLTRLAHSLEARVNALQGQHQGPGPCIPGLGTAPTPHSA
ncbi:pentraxin-4-like [Erinaceus europaeus]|uniref:Pentraxin-4-like n=1 Tax=Erinaceus europaeus TaxID=9365 RepID=A0ABM3VVA8_ERIEU|nr:pentraxin-4-like [Erinaceus europaeus]